MRLLLAAAAAMLFTATAAQAGDKAPNAPEKPICKRVYGADTGSHFQSSKRVCHTAAEWKEIEDGTERAMRELRDHSGANAAAITAGGVGGGPQ